MTPRDHLRHLADDDSARAELVELLRSAAARLTGEDPIASGGPTVTAAYTVRLTRALEAQAAALCDHARRTGERCRYCGAVLVEVGP